MAKSKSSRKRPREAEPEADHERNDGSDGAAPVATAADPVRRRGRRSRLLILGLLQRPEGATPPGSHGRHGWLRHTTRAALTRLRQAGHLLGKTKGETGTVYRIAPRDARLAPARPPDADPDPRTAGLAQEIAHLRGLDREACGRWRSLTGRAVRPICPGRCCYRSSPTGSRPPLSATSTRPARACSTGSPQRGGRARKRTSVPDRIGIRPGTVLVREWDGKPQRVTVLADGFAWNGTPYKSLSEVARAITGTRWNGPRFFGLREKTDRPG